MRRKPLALIQGKLAPLRPSRLVLPLLLALMPNSLMAQVGEYRNDLAVGVSGGYLMNSVSFYPSIKQSLHTGLTFGLTGRYMCEKYFNMLCGLQIETNYSQLGWKEVIETSNDTYERTINYLQVPLLAHLGYGRERGGVKGFFVLGPQVAFCISESEKRGGEWSDATLALRPNRVTQQYDKPVEKKFEYGITGGLGLEVSTRRGHHFTLEGRYYFGLSNIFNDTKQDPFGRSANSTIVAKVSYLFDVMKTAGR